MLKVVIDTNSLIDAASDFYNYNNRIIDLVLEGKIEAYANRGTAKENKFITRKKIVDPEFQSKLESFFEVLYPVKSSNRIDIVEDPDDNKILESAVESNADYLITSDKHLLVLEQYQGVKIVNPAQFWSIYEDEHEGWAKWLRNFVN